MLIWKVLFSLITVLSRRILYLTSASILLSILKLGISSPTSKTAGVPTSLSKYSLSSVRLKLLTTLALSSITSYFTVFPSAAITLILPFDTSTYTNGYFARALTFDMSNTSLLGMFAPYTLSLFRIGTVLYDTPVISAFCKTPYASDNGILPKL